MYAIGIDIGGTKIEGAVVDDKGKIICSKRIMTEDIKGRSRVLENINKIISELNSCQNKISGIGIGVPGFVNSKGIIVTGGPYFKSIVGVNIKVKIEKVTGLPVYIDNDANCFALAESRFGAGKGYENIAGVIWGTGIGAGIILDGKIRKGAIGGAGEFGHFDIYEIPGEGRVSSHCAGFDIIRMYKEQNGKIKDPTVEDIYISKEKKAKELMEHAINYFSIALAALVTTINPEIIVLGGGLSKLPDKVYKQLEKKVKKRVFLKDMVKGLKIIRHKISDSSGVIGAAAMVFDN